MEKVVQKDIKKRISIFFKLLNQILKNATFILYISFIGLGFGQVIFRYILNRPVTWAEELSRYLFVWSVFLGSALVINIGEHITLSFFTDLLSQRVRQYLVLCTNIILIGLVSWIFIFDGLSILKVVHSQLSPAMGIRMSLPYLSISVGGILILLNLVWNTTTQWEARYLSRKGKK